MKRLISVFLLFIISTFISVADEIEKLYLELDNVLSKRDEYCYKKENRIDSIKNIISTVLSSNELFDVYDDIYNEYFTYRADSAFYYLSIAEKIAIKNNSINELNKCRINKAFLLATTGYFFQALEILNLINRNDLEESILFDYYSAYEWVYSVLNEYADNDVFSSEFRNKEILYNDSILLVSDPNSNEYMYWSAELNSRKGNNVYAQKCYEKALVNLKVDTRLYACVTCGLAFVHKKSGNMKEYEKYLIMSAISDIICPLKENLSMQELAMYSFEKKEPDLEKANRYLNYSMNDAIFYNNRLRMLEIAKKFPPIVNKYQEKWIDKSNRLTKSVYLISLLSILLLISLLFILREIKLINRGKKILTEMNDKLRILNAELFETNITREEYVSLFLDLCASYIDKLNKYQELVKRKVKAKQFEDLAKMVNSSKMSENDAKSFFMNFDTAFITLYPNFVSEFNSLLKDDEHIIPVKGSLLNTELRIFALIRLGIKDSSRIATLLFYSPQTIYNYRTSVKNKAKNRELFEEQVKQLCPILAK